MSPPTVPLLPPPLLLPIVGCPWRLHKSWLHERSTVVLKSTGDVLRSTVGGCMALDVHAHMPPRLLAGHALLPGRVAVPAAALLVAAPLAADHHPACCISGALVC